VKIGLAQLNFKVGAIDANKVKIVEAMRSAEAADCDLLVFPELAVTGYPPEDLLLRREFVTSSLHATQTIAAASGGMTTVVGYAAPTLGAPLDGDSEGRTAYNAAAVVRDGRVRYNHSKQLLPNYGVFDEARYFARGRFHPDFYSGDLCDVAGEKVGVLICEDLWRPELADHLAAQGADLIVVLNASPFHHGKRDERQRLVQETALRTNCTIAYVNLVGGQDELVFDGGSMCVDNRGHVIAEMGQFIEGVVYVDTHAPAQNAARPPISHVEEVYEALVLGLSDYVEKNGFPSVVVGLSGGIDSALTATIAADALGIDRVLGITMPSMWSSEGSVNDSLDLAARLEIECVVVPIGEMYDVSMGALDQMFDGTEPNVAEENLQARLRGLLLMAVTNKHGGIVLATGNKSEMSVGYATLYGDMAGGFAVLKDVPKTGVFELAEWVNRHVERIPWSTIRKPPSAELAPGQADTDTLPPYPMLDAILAAYIEDQTPVAEIIESGIACEETVRRIVGMVDRNEYKRRQAAPGVKITAKAFGRDRRLPITNGWTP
jgi:NAD+ synthase (glutamine-hydrolysing)